MAPESVNASRSDLRPKTARMTPPTKHAAMTACVETGSAWSASATVAVVGSMGVGEG